MESYRKNSQSQWTELFVLKNKLWSKKEKMASEEKLQQNKLRNQVQQLTRKGKKYMKKNIAKAA